MKKILENFNLIDKSFVFTENHFNKLKLVNIGAGKTKIDFALNIDISKKADIPVDIGENPLPFEDKSVDIIFSDHTIEHVKNYLFAINEIHRVLKKGGLLFVNTPYLTLTKYNLVNPYHLHHFNEYSFDFFNPLKLRGSAAEENNIDLRTNSFMISYLPPFNYLPFFRILARKYLFNVAKEIKFAIVKGDRVDPNLKFFLLNHKKLISFLRGARKKY